MFINAGPLFGRAKAAYERTKTAPSERVSGQMDTLEAVVFSVASLEAFINEAAELATQPPTPNNPNPVSVSTFATLADEVEKARGGLSLKFTVARLAFTGQTYDRGTAPYQDFDLLMQLRNALVHYRSLDTFEVDESGNMTFKPGKILERLHSKGILAEPEPDVTAPWILIIATKALAGWACRSASAMVASILSVLPASSFKQHMDFFYAQPFQAPDCTGNAGSA